MNGTENNFSTRTAAARLGILVLGTLVLAIVAVACHGFKDPRHAVSLHNALDFEDYCVDTTESSVFDDTAATLLLDNALFPGPPHDDEAWPGLTASFGANVLWFVPVSGGCPFTGGEYQEDLSEDYIQYRFVNAANLPSYCGGYNCVGHLNPVCSTFDCSTGCGVAPTGVHCHYKHHHVNLKDTTMGASQPVVTHTINHETGHVLGLLDPAEQGRAIGPVWNQCEAELFPGYVRLTDSIMHAPPSYCHGYYPIGTIIEWPRPDDRTGVRAIMENPSIDTDFQQ